MSAEQPTPLHHLSDAEFQRHLADTYGAPSPDLADVGPAATAHTMLGPEHDAEWRAYQDARYPGTGEQYARREAIIQGIYEFVDRGAPAARLFEFLDPELARITNPEDRLVAYERLCRKHFNFRNGLERQQSKALTMDRDQTGHELWDLAFDVCGEEGMVDNSELEDGEVIKHIPIFGGTPQSIKNRSRYAVEQLGDHQATTGSIDFLAAEAEEQACVEAAKELGVDVSEANIVSRERHPEGVVITYRATDFHGKPVPVRIFVHDNKKYPDGRPMLDAKGVPMRATSLDTISFWSRVIDLRPGDNVVGVTTGMYTAFQNANSVETATWRNGARVRVIGHSAEWAGGTRTANQLLQEYKATVDSHYRTYIKAIEAGMLTMPERYLALYTPIPDMTELRAHKAGYTDEPIDTGHPLFDEPMVDIATRGVAGQNYYTRPNWTTKDAVEGAPSRILLRESFADDLQRINESLVDPWITAFFGGEVELYVEDGYRLLETQIAANRLVRERIREQYPLMLDGEVERRAQDIIAIPSDNPHGPSPHRTGGAADIILRYRPIDNKYTLGYVAGSEVPMGHFDGEVSKRLYPDYFEGTVEPVEPTEENLRAQRNRRGLEAIMSGKIAGIVTNLRANPTEWFHRGRGGQLEARTNRTLGLQALAYYSLAPVVE